MDIKKHPHKNLENKKGLFFQIGLIISLSTILLAFQYRTSTTRVMITDKYKATAIVDDIIPITIFKEKKALPPLPPPPLNPITIKVVPNSSPIIRKIEPVANPAKPNILIMDYPPEIIKNETPLPIVELMPALRGCEELRGEERKSCTDEKLKKYIKNHINYPPQAKEMEIEGKVYVSFIVNKKGKVTDTRILKGVSGGPMLDKEAIRVINSLPKFTPGEQSGRKANVIYRLPIVFKLK